MLTVQRKKVLIMQIQGGMIQNAFNVEVRELDDGLKENNQHLRKFWESEVGPITEIRRSQERTVLGGIGVREKSRFN